MSLSPLEIENIRFSRSMLGGYDRTEVERFLAQAARSIDEYVSRIDQLERQVAQLEADLQRYRENEDLLRSSVVHAQRGADELIAAARQRADAIKGEAELEAQKLRQSLSDIRNEREQFEYAFHGLLSGFIRRLEHGNPALGGAAHSAVPSPALAAPAAVSGVRLPTEAEAEPMPASVPEQPQAARSAASPPADSFAKTEPDADALDFERVLNQA